jgi:osmotically-inducible protein OsmY
MRRFLVGLLLGVAGLILVGTSRTAIADEGSNDANAKEEADIRACFQGTPDLKDDRIKVTVDDGIAVLEGTVDSQKEKKEAQKLAHVDGILGVNNRLKVSSPGKIAPAPM